MSKRILITGGAGFIGSNLVSHLNSHSPEWEITVLDNLSTGLRENLDYSKCRLIVGSILDSKLLSKIAVGVDSVIHLAALGSVPRSVSAPRQTYETNVTGTLNVLEAARQHSVEQVIVASSSSVYGSNPSIPKNEFDWTRPVSPYAASKLATEALANAYGYSYEMKTVAFRFFNVYGPKQRSDHPYAAVIPNFVSAVLAENPITIHGDGRQTRDFTFVGTVCDAIRIAIQRGLRVNHPVNLAFGTRMSLLEVVEKIEDQVGREVEVKYTEARVGDVKDSQADSTQLLELLPSISHTGFDDGLRETIEWFRSEKIKRP